MECPDCTDEMWKFTTKNDIEYHWCKQCNERYHDIEEIENEKPRAMQ